MGANTSNAVLFLLGTLFQLYLWAILLRILLQLVRADFYHPLSQVVWSITRIPLQPLQTYVPKYRRLDVAATLLAVAVAALYVSLIAGLLNLRLDGFMLLRYSALKVVVTLLNLYTFCLFAQALLSWLGPGVNNPAGSILWSLNEPLLRPVRRWLPPMGGLDLAPLALILALQFFNMLVPAGPFR